MLSNDLLGNLYQFDRGRNFDPGGKYPPDCQDFVQDGDENGPRQRVMITSETLSLARNWRWPDQPANRRSMLRLVKERWMGNCCVNCISTSSRSVRWKRQRTASSPCVLVWKKASTCPPGFMFA